MAPRFHRPTATHQGKLRTKTWSDFLNLNQEDPSSLCTHDSNTKKGCYLPPDTYIGIVYVPYHPGYIVRLVYNTWTHYIWYYDLHLSGVYVYFPTQGRLFCFTKALFFSEQDNIISVCLFIKICNRNRVSINRPSAE